MANKGGMALGFGILVLFGSIAIPAAVNSTDTTTVESQQINVGETVQFNSQIDISVINATNTEASIRVTDTETGETEDRTIPTGETTSFNYTAGTILVTNEVSNPQSATIRVEYPSNYGFNPAAEIVADNMALILISMFFVSIMAFVGIRT